MEVLDLKGGGVHALLHQKELELQNLRETSLRELEEKVCVSKPADPLGGVTCRGVGALTAAMS
jgi:hypothetical protein